MKKVIALILAMVMVAALFAGCGKTAEPAAAETTAAKAETTAAAETAAAETTAEEPVTLNAWYYADIGTDVGYQAWADSVHEAYPWITIALEELPYDSGPEKFTVACATGTTPDLYFDGFSRISPAVFGNLCLDLSDVAKDYQDLFTAEQTDGVVDGKNYYIAMQTGGAYGLLVNLDLAEKLGVKDMLPTDWTQWSYEDFLNICRAAKKADPNVAPTALYAGSRSSDAVYYSMLLGNGAQLTNEDLSATAFNEGESREKALETLTFLKTLIDEGLCPSGSATATDEDVDQYWFAGNELFAVPVGMTAMTYYQGAMDSGLSAVFDYDVLAYPTQTGDYVPNSASWGTYGVCAFDNGGHGEAIKLALSVMLENPEFQSTICTACGKLPLLSTTVVEYSTDALAEKMGRAAEYSADHCLSNFGILEPWWTDFRETLYPQLQDFYVGKIDAGTVLDNWQAAADPIIAAAKTE